MTRTYDPALDDVYVNRDGTIRWDGDAIGVVGRLSDADTRAVGARWRAEVGDSRTPEAWPGYRAAYGRTRKDAVAGALEGVQVPS